MNTARMNITIPLDVAKRLRGVKNKSAVITEALRREFAEEDAEKIRRELEAAYRENAAASRTIAEEWDVVSGDNL